MFDRNIKPSEINRSWYIVNAKDKILGRLASKVADILRGKYHTYFSPQWDMGDYVVVTNAEKVVLTGKKEKQKIYYRHTGYPGGIRQETAENLLKRKPEEVIYRAVKGMLPKNRLSRQIIKKLYIYAGENHPHGSHKLKELKM